MFAYFSFTLGEAPESKGAEALEKSLLTPNRCPAALRPTLPHRPPCLGVRRQRPTQNNVKKATQTHTHPPIQIIK